MMPAALVAWVKGLLGEDGGLLRTVKTKQAKQTLTRLLYFDNEAVN